MRPWYREPREAVAASSQPFFQPLSFLNALAVPAATTEVIVSQMTHTNPQAKLLVLQDEAQRLDTEDPCESSQAELAPETVHRIIS